MKEAEDGINPLTDKRLGTQTAKTHKTKGCRQFYIVFYNVAMPRRARRGPAVDPRRPVAGLLRAFRSPNKQSVHPEMSGRYDGMKTR